MFYATDIVNNESKCFFYVLSLIDKQVYVVQNITEAEYPRTLKEIRGGGIDKVLNLLGHVDISEIKDKKKLQ